MNPNEIRYDPNFVDNMVPFSEEHFPAIRVLVKSIIISGKSELNLNSCDSFILQSL